DPVSVDKELEVLPPLWDSTTLLNHYVKSPKKVSEEMEGKTIDIRGTVRFVTDYHREVVLEYVPRTDARGRIEHDFEGRELLGRSLVTVHSNDDTVSKNKIARGTSIEPRGVIGEMKAGAILIKNATLTK